MPHDTTRPLCPDSPPLVAMRQSVAGLFQAVLQETLSPTQAIARWPQAAMALAAQDPSLHAAYVILWFFEADEDHQRGEVFYLDTQLELLRVVNRCLAAGEALPDSITSHYAQYEAVPFYQSERVFQDVTQRLASGWQSIGRWVHLAKTILSDSRNASRRSS